MILTNEQQKPFTVGQMGEEYTEYYKIHDSDSPPESRKELRNALLNSITEKLSSKPTLNILDMGGGKQIFEHEVENDPQFAKYLPRITWLTIDISSIPKKNMLASKTADAIQANGAELPFASNSFDIVFSSMAIDFMPRESFNEVKRVLKSDGNFHVNFHHPNLITIAESALPEALRRFHSAKKNFTYKKINKSRKTDVAKHKLDVATIEFKDLQFILNNFPAHIFYSCDEVFNTLLKYFGNAEIKVFEEKNSSGRNGWFYAQVLLNA